THRKGRGDAREWVDLQLPLYRRLLSGVVDDEGQQVVRTDSDGNGSIELGYISLPKNTEESAFMLAPWTEEELAEAEEVARGAVRTLRTRRFEFDPAVTKSGWFGGDALEPLLAKGWQTSGEEDSGALADENVTDGGDR
ncbi:MAG: hypothetical protein HOJ74_05245, partial [Gemmatimonadales bacterium]|nr:hypothetical protein [Gemmatimonadales bacterium]